MTKKNQKPTKGGKNMKGGKRWGGAVEVGTHQKLEDKLNKKIEQELKTKDIK